MKEDKIKNKNIYYYYHKISEILNSYSNCYLKLCYFCIVFSIFYILHCNESFRTNNVYDVRNYYFCI